MTNKLKFWRIVLASFAATVLMAAAAYSGEAPADLGGWGDGSDYNKLYNARELDRIKGEVEGFEEVVPLPGMSPATAFYLRESEEDKILVHVCPEWFASAKEVGLRRGDVVKIRGSWAEIDGEDVFMASKIKKGDFFEFKVRLTKNGKPFWTMSPEELAKETSGE